MASDTRSTSPSTVGDHDGGQPQQSDPRNDSSIDSNGTAGKQLLPRRGTGFGRSDSQSPPRSSSPRRRGRAGHSGVSAEDIEDFVESSMRCLRVVSGPQWDSITHYIRRTLPKPREEKTEEDGTTTTVTAAPTRIGRRRGMRPVEDQAFWEDPLPVLTAKEDFAIVIEHNIGEPDNLVLTSSHLQKAFKAAAPYFPGVQVAAETVSFEEPYRPLYFYFDAIRDQIESSPEKDAAKTDFDVLNRFYAESIKVNHDDIRNGLRNFDIRFDDLWALFRPGELLYMLGNLDEPQLCLAGDCSYLSGHNDFWGDDSLSPGRNNQRTNYKDRLRIVMWSIVWDASVRRFTRQPDIVDIFIFTGTRKVMSLPCYPFAFHSDASGATEDGVLDRLEKRGHKWKELVSGDPSPWHHSGPAFPGVGPMLSNSGQSVFSSAARRRGRRRVRYRRVNLDGRVVVDSGGGDILTSRYDSDSDDNVRGRRQYDLDPAFAEFDNHPPEKPFSALQARLSPALVNCYSLKSRGWYRVAMPNLSPIEWDEKAFENLVLEGGFKTMLHGLIEQHKRTSSAVQSDFIAGKGAGLVMVLYGDPGLGKSFTAESVAEHTHRVLFSINVGELGSNQAIDLLEHVFDQAARWDAVLLLDEADVLLEERSFEDIVRNSIVSTFLRLIEYYQGIVFLTSNRLDTMDSAFQSRISLAVKYKPLSKQTRRQIWEKFLARLGDANQGARADLEKRLDDMSEWAINGRQIRNIMKMAQALAWNRRRIPGGLTFEDLERAAEETINFQEDMKTLAKQKKAQLANVSGDHSWPGN